MQASAGICNTMRIKNKAQVVGKKGTGTEQAPARPLEFRRSVAHASFVDFVGLQAKNWQQVNSGDDFQDAFDAVSSHYPQDADDKFISLAHLHDVLVLALGEDLPLFVEEKFSKLCKRAEVGGRVYWADFRRLATSALAAATADCTIKRELPPLVMLMTKPRLIDPDLGPMSVARSAYADTFGPKFSDLTKQPFSAPAQSTYTKFLVRDGVVPQEQELRPKSILNPAAADLSAGTPKGTCQIPGYTGHMPRSVRNPRKLDHSSGDHLHPVVNSLRMTKKGGSNVLGYAGHVPWHADSERERLSGCDPRTSTGAAFGATRLPL